MAQARTNGKTKSSDFADLNDQLATIKSDIAELSSILGDVATSKAGDARAKGAELAGAAKAHARETAARGRAAAENAYLKSEDAVRRKPALAVGVAAALGFVAGFMMTGRKS